MQLGATDRPAPIEHEIDPEPPAETARQRGLIDDLAVGLDEETPAYRDPHTTSKSQGVPATIARSYRRAP